MLQIFKTKKKKNEIGVQYKAKLSKVFHFQGDIKKEK